ncbi:hypothetical protein V5F77_16995 [Xanthobacter sp. DSM 24535]|uniref:hypothetical protein n=1 Tax=Roseixanthobacter psychrophilus TaxID=3119917 RepID=UPI00372BC537
MALRKILFGGMVALLSAAPAFADYYPSTLSQEERERHEFLDVQKADFPSGQAPAYMSSMPPGDLQMPTMTGGATIPSKPRL